MIDTPEKEVEKLRAEVATKQKRENAAIDRAKRAEDKVASLRLENQNLRALVVHLGCPNCKIGEIALTIHRMLFADETHSHATTLTERVFILHEGDKR